MNGARILVVEDDAALAEMLQSNLEREGFCCELAADGEDGLRQARASAYSIIVLDRMLPKLNGIDLLKQLRQEGNRVPVVFLTSKAEEVDKIIGLELGADDYVTKPFAFGELLARLRALLRRSGAPQGAAEGASRICLGPLIIDTRTRKASVRGDEVRLTALEFDLLLYLASTPGVPRSRQQILESVWQTTFVGYEDSVNAAIKRLRQKIEERPASPQLIQTVRGVGYAFFAE